MILDPFLKTRAKVKVQTQHFWKLRVLSVWRSANGHLNDTGTVQAFMDEDGRPRTIYLSSARPSHLGDGA